MATSEEFQSKWFSFAKTPQKQNRYYYRFSIRLTSKKHLSLENMCGTCAGTPQPRTQQWESSLPECTHTSSIADVMKCSFNVGFWRNEIFSVLQFQRNCFLHLLMCYIQGSIVESPPGDLGMLRNIEKEEPTWLIWSLNLSCLFFFAIFRLHYLVLLQWSLLRVIKTI